MAGKIERQGCGAGEDLTCARCGGFVLCESWCESVNARVRYARDVVLQDSRLVSAIASSYTRLAFDGLTDATGTSLGMQSEVRYSEPELRPVGNSRAFLHRPK